MTTAIKSLCEVLLIARFLLIIIWQTMSQVEFAKEHPPPVSSLLYIWVYIDIDMVSNQKNTQSRSLAYMYCLQVNVFTSALTRLQGYLCGLLVSLWRDMTFWRRFYLLCLSIWSTCTQFWAPFMLSTSSDTFAGQSLSCFFGFPTSSHGYECVSKLMEKVETFSSRYKKVISGQESFQRDVLSNSLWLKEP